jgi:hypothetical protein
MDILTAVLVAALITGLAWLLFRSRLQRAYTGHLVHEVQGFYRMICFRSDGQDDTWS